MKRWCFGLAIAGFVMASFVGLAQGIWLSSSQGSGWIMLDLEDLNKRLSQAGYPTLSETAQVYGNSTLFPQEETPLQLGFTGLFWSAKRGDIVSLDAGFVGGVLDWTLRSLPAGRLSTGTAVGLTVAQLLIRKSIALGFDDVLHPSQGQFSKVQRWGVWGAPYLQYEVSVLESDFYARAWGGFLWTPWLSRWNQSATFVSSTEFDGPPANLGGPFFMLELSFKL